MNDSVLSQAKKKKCDSRSDAASETISQCWVATLPTNHLVPETAQRSLPLTVLAWGGRRAASNTEGEQSAGLSPSLPLYGVNW